MPTAPGPHDAGIEYGVLAADIAADNMAAHIAAADERAVMTDSTAKGFTLVYREQSFMPPTTAPGAHDDGIDYGVLAADIAADNKAAHITAKADQEMSSSARSGGMPSYPPAPAPAQGDGFSGRGPRSILRAPPEYTEGELATTLRNFEDFQLLPIGSATVEQLQSSSAKIGGWLCAGQGREARASEQHAPVMAARAPQPPPSQPPLEGGTDATSWEDAWGLNERNPAVDESLELEWQRWVNWQDLCIFPFEVLLPLYQGGKGESGRC